MISNSFNIHQFIEAVKGKNRNDTIDLAENEAVLAWQSTYCKGCTITQKQKQGMTYHNQLLRLIDYIRYGVLKQAREIAVQLALQLNNRNAVVILRSNSHPISVPTAAVPYSEKLSSL